MKNSNGKKICMHSMVMDCLENKLVDHIKHINYDNRKSQLRISDKSKNGMNMKLLSDNKFGCKEVFWHKNLEKWCAKITVNKKEIYLLYTTDFNKAVKARKEAEEKYFGEYSYDNSMKAGVQDA